MPTQDPIVDKRVIKLIARVQVVISVVSLGLAFVARGLGAPLLFWTIYGLGTGVFLASGRTASRIAATPWYLMYLVWLVVFHAYTYAHAQPSPGLLFDMPGFYSVAVSVYLLGVHQVQRREVS